MNPHVRLVLTLVLLSALSGCATVKGWFRSESEKATDPVPLVELESPASVDEIWSRSLGDGEGLSGTRQRPASDGDAVYAADDEGRLLALDPATGKTRWTVELDPVTGQRGWRVWRKTVPEGGLLSSPGVGEGLVAVVGRSGVLHAVDASDGKEKWTAQVSAEVLAAPLVSNGIVVVRSQDGRLSAFDVVTGARRWVAESSVPSLTIRGAASPVAASGLIIAGFDDGKLRAYAAADGRPVWEAVIGEPEGRTELDRASDVDAALSVGAGVIYATSARGVTAAVDLNTGQLLWTREDTGSHVGTDITADGLLLVDRDGVFYSLDRATGSALWKQDMLLRRQPSSVVLSGSLAVVGDVEGWLHWVDPQSGQTRARARVGRDPIRAAPLVLVDGTVIAVTIDGRLSAYRLEP